MLEGLEPVPPTGPGPSTSVSSRKSAPVESMFVALPTVLHKSARLSLSGHEAARAHPPVDLAVQSRAPLGSVVFCSRCGSPTVEREASVLATDCSVTVVAGR